MREVGIVDAVLAKQVSDRRCSCRWPGALFRMELSRLQFSKFIAALWPWAIEMNHAPNDRLFRKPHVSTGIWWRPEKAGRIFRIPPTRSIQPIIRILPSHWP